MLTNNSVEVDKKKKGLSIAERLFSKDLYQRDCIAKEIFKNNTNKPVTVENLKKVLSTFFFPPENKIRKRRKDPQIKENLLMLCSEIDKNKNPHSKHVTEFYSVAGSTSKKVGAIGCYGLVLLMILLRSISAYW